MHGLKKKPINDFYTSIKRMGMENFVFYVIPLAQHLAPLYEMLLVKWYKPTLNTQYVNQNSKKQINDFPSQMKEAYYDFKKPPTDIELAYEDYAHEFCVGNVDAIMIMAGHPSALVNFITHACESDFVTIDSSKVNQLLKSNPGFHNAILPEGGYPGITKDQDTIGVNAILVTADHVDKKITQNFLDLFPSIVDRFKSSHPALYDIDAEDFRKNFVLPAFVAENVDNKEA